MLDNDSFAQLKATKEWEKARQAAIIEEMLSALPFRNSTELLPFDEVQRKLRLSHKNYRGLQEVPLAQIRGSVGRYRDFTMTFLPRREKMRDRWMRVSATAESAGFPPIELYKVGDAYFVLDGNHRVSVARQMGAETIQAHVWEFTTPVGLSASADLDELLIKEEYASFLERTRLDKLRPGAKIEFTTPGRYREIEYQIALYQQVLEKIDGTPVSYEDAAAAWYDMIFTPICQIIEQEGILQRFPGRTAADLFIWVWRYHRQLKVRGIDSLTVAIHRLGRKQGPFVWLRRLWERIISTG
ncbi:MAG: hypothetical protein Kow00124_02260 [Anaerolineae bacterium]